MTSSEDELPNAAPIKIFIPTFSQASQEPRDQFTRDLVEFIRRRVQGLPEINADRPCVNPFKREQSRPARRAVLGAEIVKLYGAVAFAMREHGIVMNAHITIVWQQLGVEDHGEAARLLSAFNHEAAKWLRVGLGDASRQRLTKRAAAGGGEHVYIYVHENGRRHGFHTHELAFIPPVKASSFEDWARSCLARLSGRGRISDRALVIKVANNRGEDQNVARCWAWFRYITKSLSPNASVRDDDGRLISARAVFKSAPFIEKPPVHTVQRASGSRNIWTKAQRQAGFVSRYHGPGELDRLFDGSELEARRTALRLADEEAKWAAVLKTLNL